MKQFMAIPHIAQRRHQHGAILIVSLILLTVLTVLGIATMDTTGIQMKMANNSRDAQQAFEIAEEALREIEIQVLDKYGIDNFQDCSTECFNPNCDDGLCFVGSFDRGIGCKANSYASTTDAKEPWANPAIWSDSTRHMTYEYEQPDDGSGTTETVSVKYIVEFRCFAPRDPDWDTWVKPTRDGDSWGNNAAPLWRITTYTEGPAKRGRAMVQSNYKALDIFATGK